MLLCPGSPLYPSFGFCTAVLNWSFPHAGFPLVTFYLQWVAPPLQANWEPWSEVVFLQIFYSGRLVMELPLSFVPGLLLLLWERCSAPYRALSCIGFLGSDVLTVVSFERCHHMVQRSFSVLGIWGDGHIKLFLIYTLESGNLKSILSPIYMWITNLSDNKAFDTEILSCYEKALQVKAE